MRHVQGLSFVLITTHSTLMQKRLIGIDDHSQHGNYESMIIAKLYTKLPSVSETSSITQDYSVNKTINSHYRPLLLLLLES